MSAAPLERAQVREHVLRVVQEQVRNAVRKPIHRSALSQLAEEVFRRLSDQPVSPQWRIVDDQLEELILGTRHG